VATVVKPPARLPPLAGGIGAALLLLASCGGGGTAAPALPVVTPTPLPTGQWISFWEADAVWQQIVESATLVKPVLRPTYLPPGLTEVRRLETEEPSLRFGIIYADGRHTKWLTLSAGRIGNTTLPGPRTQQDQVVIRNTYATYQLYDTEDPTSDSWMLWQEQGRWGTPGDPNLPNLDRVPYLISSYGLTRGDLVKVADSLRPVEE
jgi:hypothetical protein